MTSTSTCPRCGARFPAVTPAGQCPRCLLRIGLDTDFVVTGAGQSTKRPPPSIEEIARDFPELEVLALIGQGGMGTVYKARQRNLDRLVALKILTVDTASDPTFAERFAREARTLANLDHQNIVRVHDSGRAGERYFLSMELVDGTDLRHLMRAGRIAPREGLAIVTQVCDALQYAHDRGVVHRDIKPENILVDKAGRVKIADFGLAKLIGRADDAFALTGSHQSMGTPHYMAPEQIERPQEVDHRADIYSLGVVLYELLTGELPLGRFVPPSRRVEVDVRIDEVVLKALEKDVPLRYQHASEVRTSLDAASLPPAHPAAVPPAASAPTTANNSKWVVAALAMIAIGAVAVAGLLAVFSATADAAANSEVIPGYIRFGPWILVAVAALSMWGVARWARPRGQPQSPWLLGCGCLVFGLLLAAVMLVMFLPLSMSGGDDAGREIRVGAEPHGPFCAEVDAALEIRARVDRLAELVKLTQRAGLSAHEMRHIAGAICEGGFFEDNADAFVSLIEHQQLTGRAIETIRSAVLPESPSPHRQRVLDALSMEAENPPR